jgi:hypothetical protein
MGGSSGSFSEEDGLRRSQLPSEQELLEGMQAVQAAVEAAEQEDGILGSLRPVLRRPDWPTNSGVVLAHHGPRVLLYILIRDLLFTLAQPVLMRAGCWQVSSLGWQARTRHLAWRLLTGTARKQPIRKSSGNA